MIKRAISSVLRRAGYERRRAAPEPNKAMFDQPNWVIDIITRVAPFTMTSPERVAALCQAVRHICKHQIAGDIVECGVWRGGSMMAACLALLHHGDRNRDVHLLDTFEGMTPPSEFDIEASTHVSASELVKLNEKTTNLWAISSFDEVKQNIGAIGYPADRIHFIKGKVEDTVPAYAPETIAILRLDTDWYESTLHELRHLFPRLVPGGFLIVDDYGHWDGARRAVDEFIGSTKSRLFLTRIDYSGRLAIKP
jgi:O-methyltransferase